MQTILLVLGSLGLFLFGMKTLSSGLQKAAGENLRQLINKIAYNDFSSVMTGTILTVLVQSSTATSVLFVGLANAGLINLRQSIALIMGANVGTTIKAIVIAYSGANINIESLALFFAAIALPFLFIRRNSFRAVADILMGLAIMFLSIVVIQNSITHIDENTALVKFLTNASEMGFGGILLALLTGMVITMIVQSSSAIMTLTLILSQQGILSFEMAAAMIIGENIGTTITANLAAIVANRNAKRVALYHTLFNLFNAVWALALFYPILNFTDYLVENFSNQGSPYTDNDARTYALAILHIGYNIVNVFILIWFIPYSEKLLKSIIREEKTSDQNGENFKLKYIQTGIIKSPELDLVEVKKAIEHLGKVNQQMFKLSESLLTRNENTEFYNNLQRIHELETVTDKLEDDITIFLNKISENDISKTTTERIRSYLTVSKEMERLADSIYQVSKVYERKLVQRIWFNPDQREGIRELISLNHLLIEGMQELINGNNSDAFANFEVNRLKLIQSCEQLKSHHMESIEQQDFNIKSGTVFIDLISIYQRISEHVNSICNNFKA